MIGSTGVDLHSKLPVVQKKEKNLRKNVLVITDREWGYTQPRKHVMSRFLHPKDGARRQVKVFTEG